MAEIYVRDPKITGLSLNIDDAWDPDAVVTAFVDVVNQSPQATPTYAQSSQSNPNDVSGHVSTSFGYVTPSTCAPIGGGYVGGSIPFTPPAPLTGWDTFETIHMPDPCAGGHVADPKHTEISDDGEVLAAFIVTKCIGCGEKIIVERVPGGIPALQLKLFVGSVMGLDLDIEDEDFNVSEMLGALKTLKEAIEREDDALKRAKSLVALGEKILRKKVNEHSVRAGD